MGAFFSSKSKESQSRVTEQDRAVLSLKKHRDTLRQYQKNLENTLIKDRNLAKELLKQGRRDRAKLLLKKQKLTQSLLAKSEAQLDNVEELTSTIEFKQIEIKALDSLKTASAQLTKLNNLYSLSQIEDILSDSQEGVEKQREIELLLSGGDLSVEELDEVEGELEDIIAGEGVVLPEVPSTDLEEEEEEDKVPVPTKKKEKRIAVEAS